MNTNMVYCAVVLATAIIWCAEQPVSLSGNPHVYAKWLHYYRLPVEAEKQILSLACAAMSNNHTTSLAAVLPDWGVWIHASGTGVATQMVSVLLPGYVIIDNPQLTLWDTNLCACITEWCVKQAFALTLSNVICGTSNAVGMVYSCVTCNVLHIDDETDDILFATKADPAKWFKDNTNRFVWCQSQLAYVIGPE